MCDCPWCACADVIWKRQWGLFVHQETRGFPLWNDGFVTRRVDCMKRVLVLSILICAFVSPASLAQDRASGPGQTLRQQPIVSGNGGIVVNTDLVTLNV